MKIIKKLADFISDELEGAEDYIECALLKKEEYPQLAKVLYDMSMQEMHHVEMLHAEVVKMIEKHRQEKGEPPAAMLAVWDYIHEKQIEESKEIKMLQAEFRNNV